jgi:hypothetical protein
MKKPSPSSGQNGQLVHWWLLVHSGRSLLVASLRVALTEGLILHIQNKGFEAVPIASHLLCSELCDPAPISPYAYSPNSERLAIQKRQQRLIEQFMNGKKDLQVAWRRQHNCFVTEP